MVLGKLPVPGRPTVLITVGQGPTALAVGAGGGGFDIFILIYPFSSPSPSLWGTARYRLLYCLKGPLNPKQPTKKSLVIIKYASQLLVTPPPLPFSDIFQHEFFLRIRDKHMHSSVNLSHAAFRSRL